MSAPGDADVMAWEELPDPQPRNGEVLVRVAATAVNRADLLQRQGHYPPPAGTTEVIGLEVSGIREDTGEQVCALLAGGGYAERVAVPVGQLMPVPPGVDLVTAAALPEAAATVWSNLVLVGGLAAGQWLLVHGGGSGIGTHAIQSRVPWGRGSPSLRARLPSSRRYARSSAPRCSSTTGTRTSSSRVRAATDGRRVDVILDVMGASYLPRNVDALRHRWPAGDHRPAGRSRRRAQPGSAPGQAGVGARDLAALPQLEDEAEICRAVVEHVAKMTTAGSAR